MTEMYKNAMSDPVAAQQGMKILERAAIKKQLETSDVANLTFFSLEFTKLNDYW